MRVGETLITFHLPCHQSSGSSSKPYFGEIRCFETHPSFINKGLSLKLANVFIRLVKFL
jgi:hypothetical protein